MVPMIKNFVRILWQNELLSTITVLNFHLTEILMILKVTIINHVTIKEFLEPAY